MPANRSRTERWRECLDQIYERSGGLELSLDRQDPSAPAGEGAPTDLIWRVRILALTETSITVEQPAAMGQTMPLAVGSPLIVGMTIGQNRWMFQTRVESETQIGQAHGRGIPAIVLTMPGTVERCQRRSFYRMSTGELRLPVVQCWPLLNPASAVAAEVANRALITEMLENSRAAPSSDAMGDPLVLPEVGPSFPARLVNIGGGGAGLVLERGVSAGTDRTRTLWLRLDLRPQIPAPIAITGKVVHNHIDSTQSTYLGLAFDFSHHPAHREFVASQICRYVLANQREQTARRAG